MSATTKKDAAMAKAQAELAKKREAEAVAEADEMRRDVPPGIEETPPTPAYFTPPEALNEILRNFKPVTKPPLKLYAAIHRTQAKIETVRKNGENPHFKSKYATLDEVWETIRGAVNEAGLVVFCTIDKADGEGKRELTTHVVEVTSGEEISCSFPIVTNAASPQAIGSGMTYARRYTLTALLEIVTGDGADDDGEAATNRFGTSVNANPPASAAAEALGF